MQEKSSGTVVFFRGDTIEYLLLHYESGHWDFPKGHMEPGESEKETALRELKEEAGLDGIIAEGFRETMKYFFRKRGAPVAKTVVFFLAESKTKSVKLSREHIGFNWLPYEEAMEQITYGNAKEMLRKANDFLSKKSLRDFV